MPVRVVDASALGALVFGEPWAEDVASKLADAPLAAPALFWFELASVCLKKLRAHPRQADKILAAFRLAQRLPIMIHDVDHLDTVVLAHETRLTTYDASYQWLARRLRADLVTLDEPLEQAATRRPR